MKILKLEFSNINSLKGHHVIDFTDSAFTDNGIFAITGNTGSGKSTILDAITLALFHKTPRANSISSSNNEIMTKGAYYCESHLTFEIDGVIYIASFKQRKKQKIKEGILDIFYPKECSVSKVDTKTNEAKPLSTKSTDCPKIVEEKTGLNFDRFTRAVMLCQGNFASFLRANKSDKVSILEKLSDTKKYSNISKFIFEYYKKEEQKINEIKNKLTSLNLLSDEDCTNLQKECLSLDKDTQEVQTKLNKLNEDKINKERFNKLLEQKEQAILEQRSLKDIEVLKDLHNKAIKAKNIDVIHQKVLKYAETISKQEEEKKNNEIELINLYNKQKELTNLLQKEQVRLEDMDKKTKEEETRIVKAQNFDDKIKNLSLNKDNLEKKIKILSKDLDLRHDEYNTINTSLEATKIDLAHKQNLITKLNINLSDITKVKGDIEHVFNNLKEKASSALSKINEIDALNKDLVSLQAKVQEQEELYKTSLYEKEIKQQELEELENTFASHNLLSLDVIIAKKDELNKIQASLQELQKKNGLFAKNITSFIQKINDYLNINKNLVSLNKEISDTNTHKNTTKNLVDSIQNEIHSQDIIKSLKAHRDNLLDNTPCPLCGSLDHPYCTDNVDKNLNSDLKNKLNEANKSLEKLNKKIDTLNKDISKNKEKARSLEENIQDAYEQNKDFLNQDLSSLSIGIDVDNIFTIIEKDLALALNAFTKLEDFNVILIEEQCQTNLHNIDIIYKDYLNKLIFDINAYTNDITTINTFNNNKNTLLNNIKDLEHKVNKIKEPLSQINSDKNLKEKELEILNSNLNQDKDDLDKILKIFLEHIFNRYTISLFKESKVCFSSFICDIENILSFDSLDNTNKDIQNLIKTYNSCTQHIKSKCFTQDNIDLLLSYLNDNNDFNAFKDLSICCEETNKVISIFLKTIEDTFNNINKDIDKSHKELDALSTKKNPLSEAIAKNQATLNTDKSNLATLEVDLNKAKEDRFNTLNVIDLISYKKKIELDFNNQKNKVSKDKDDLFNIKNKISIYKNNSENISKAIEDKIALKIEDENGIKNLLQESPFNHIDEIKDFLLDEDKLKALKFEIDSIDDKKKNLSITLDTLNKEILNIENSINTSKDLASFESEIDELHKKIEELNNNKFIIKQKLDENEKNKNKHCDTVKELEVYKQKFENIAILNKLIGSQTGEKFSLFVQTLSLNYIIKLANIELNKLTNRYLLINHDNESLDFDVIDRYRGNVQRSSSNLSGGESFIVSLALALALSKMVSQKIQINSLFLDEGFGTLDDESLGIALGALNSMKTEGKLIGIISHVSKLKENIKTQIEVKPKGDGTSQLYLNDKKLSN